MLFDFESPVFTIWAMDCHEPDLYIVICELGFWAFESNQVHACF